MCCCRGCSRTNLQQALACAGYLCVCMRATHLEDTMHLPHFSNAAAVGAEGSIESAPSATRYTSLHMGAPVLISLL